MRFCAWDIEIYDNYMQLGDFGLATQLTRTSRKSANLKIMHLDSSADQDAALSTGVGTFLYSSPEMLCGEQ